VTSATEVVIVSVGMLPDGRYVARMLNGRGAAAEWSPDGADSIPDALRKLADAIEASARAEFGR